MTATTERKHSGEFIAWEEANYYSRDTGTLLSGESVVAGEVLGKVVNATTATSAAAAGNTGNGTMGTVTLSQGALPGVYKVIITEAATGAGAFVVEDPLGVTIGTGDVAAAFSGGGLAFTLADGATDFAAGDYFTITVAVGSGKYKALDLTAVNGAQFAAAIAFEETDATAADAEIVIVDKHCQVNDHTLTWPDGITVDQKAAAVAQLRNLGIIVLGA